MKNLLLLFITFVVLIVIFVWYMSSSNVVMHTIVFDNTTLYSGNAPSIVSSDGVDRIVSANSLGINEFNTTTGVKRLVNSTRVTGLAYDGESFMTLEANGALKKLNDDGTLTPLTLGCQRLYDTSDGGYFIKVDGVSSATGETGTFTPANGSYGLIDITVK